jgi:hypothetical protein
MLADISIWVVVAYVFSAFCVFMFGVNEFCKPISCDNYKNDNYKNVIAQALPFELTSERSFLVAWIVYVFGLLLIFASLSALLKPLLPILVPEWKEKIIDEAVPILAAFCLIGFLPNIPGLRSLEQWWREFMHRRASIPRAINDVVDEINSREFAYSRLPKMVLDKIIPFADSDQPLVSLKEAVCNDRLSISARNWILASAIMNSIVITKSDGRAVKRISLEFIRRHAEHLNSLFFEYKQLEEEITNRRSSLSIDDLNSCADENFAKIGELLDKAKIFVACLVVSRPPHVRLEEALDCLFFDDTRRSADFSKNHDEQDALVLAFGVGLLFSFLLFAILPFFSPLLPSSLSKGWPSTEAYGQILLSWLTDQLRYLPIPFLLLSYRHSRIVRNDWFDGKRQGVRELEYAKIFFPALLGSIAIAFLAPMLEIYVIWQKDMPAPEFFRGFQTYYWISPIVISVFSITLIMLLDLIRYHPNKDPISFSIKSLSFLGGLTTIAGILVYGSREMGALVTYAFSTIVFFAVVLTVARVRVVDAQHSRPPLRRSLQHLVSTFFPGRAVVGENLSRPGVPRQQLAATRAPSRLREVQAGPPLTATLSPVPPESEPKGSCRTGRGRGTRSAH